LPDPRPRRPVPIVAAVRALPRLIALALVVGALAAVVAGAVPHSPDALRAAVAAHGAWAPLVLLAAWVVLTPALVSGPLLCAACGLALGVAGGSAVSLAGATLGGVVAFLLGRRLGAPAVAQLAGPRLRRWQAGAERHGFRAVLCARLAPGVPATLLHYAVGLTRIRLRDFAAGIALGGLPRIVAYTALGGALGDPMSPAGALAVGLLAAMALVGVAVAWRSRSLGHRAA
jgi:uncharacterized membrane protein YdjX (TVP38/TMEM64 family)